MEFERKNRETRRALEMTCIVQRETTESQPSCRFRVANSVGLGRKMLQRSMGVQGLRDKERDRFGGTAYTFVNMDSQIITSSFHFFSLCHSSSYFFENLYIFFIG